MQKKIEPVSFSEKTAIDSFLRDSKTFKTLKVDALNGTHSGFLKQKQELIQRLTDANTFAEMLELIDNFDPVKTENIIVKTFFMAATQIGRYVSYDAEFQCCLPSLRDELIKFAVDNGFYQGLTIVS